MNDSELKANDFNIEEKCTVADEDLAQFARFLLPRIQAFYESDEGKRAFTEWKEKRIA